MAENGCTMIVWCNDCNGAGSQASAHVYDGAGHYLYSTKVDGSLCCGGCDPVVYNMGDIKVANPSGGGGRAIGLTPMHAAANFEKMVEAIDTQSSPAPTSTRFAAEQAVNTNNYRHVSVPIEMLSPRARRLLRRHHARAGAPTAMAKTVATSKGFSNIKVAARGDEK